MVSLAAENLQTIHSSTQISAIAVPLAFSLTERIQTWKGVDAIFSESQWIIQAERQKLLDWMFGPT